MPPDATRHVRACIHRTVRAKDARGAAQAERLLALELATRGRLSIALNTAAAARRLGEWLRSV